MALKLGFGFLELEGDCSAAGSAFILYPHSNTQLTDSLDVGGSPGATADHGSLSVAMVPRVTGRRFSLHDHAPPISSPLLAETRLPRFSPSSHSSLDDIPDPLSGERLRGHPWPASTGGQHRHHTIQAIANLQLTAIDMAALWKATFCMFPDHPRDYMRSEARAFHDLMIKVLMAERLPTSDPRAKVVLIHCSGLPELYRLSHLQARLKDVKNVTFYTYGWAPNLHPKRGLELRPIFPIGACCLR